MYKNKINKYVCSHLVLTLLLSHNIQIKSFGENKEKNKLTTCMRERNPRDEQFFKLFDRKTLQSFFHF